MRNLTAFLSGGLFGAGLLVSDMVDTRRVIGFLDIFGAWDPTLAFVLGGAILPMALAWRIAAARRSGASLLGTPLPAPAGTGPDRGLIAGSVMFGAGWGLVGLCPGPALASLTFGGWGGALFLLAMLGGMVLTPGLAARAPALISRPAATVGDAKGKPMDIRPLTPDYAVSPQIGPSDLAAVKAAGFVTVINNRPDGEIPPDLHSEEMRRAAEAIGLRFVANPVIGGGLTMANVTAQAEALAASPGPVFAYCASGNRCSIVWALAHAGRRPTDELIGVPAQYGYQLEHLRPQIEALAAQG